MNYKYVIDNYLVIVSVVSVRTQMFPTGFSTMLGYQQMLRKSQYWMELVG